MNNKSSLSVNQIVDKLFDEYPKMNKLYLLFSSQSTSVTKMQQRKCEILGVAIINEDQTSIKLKYDQIIHIFNGTPFVTFKENKNRLLDRKQKYQFLVILTSEKNTFIDTATKKEILYYASQTINATDSKVAKKLLKYKVTYDTEINKKFQLDDIEDDENSD